MALMKIIGNFLLTKDKKSLKWFTLSNALAASSEAIYITRSIIKNCTTAWGQK